MSELQRPARWTGTSRRHAASHRAAAAAATQLAERARSLLSIEEERKRHARLRNAGPRVKLAGILAARGIGTTAPEP